MDFRSNRGAALLWSVVISWRGGQDVATEVERQGFIPRVRGCAGASCAPSPLNGLEIGRERLIRAWFSVPGLRVLSQGAISRPLVWQKAN